MTRKRLRIWIQRRQVYGWKRYLLYIYVNMKLGVFSQPVSIVIDAESMYFQSYKSGVLDSSKCGTKFDHDVLIVGYGEENGRQKY